MSPPWTEVFAEISLRALLRIHHDYLLWSIQQTWSEVANVSALNRGPGVALADETTVCAAISQEFLASRFPAGSFVGSNQSFNIQAGHRYYRLTREVLYKDSTKRSDFFIQRIDTAGQPMGQRPGSLIEAKRAFLWSTKHNGEVERVTSQKEEIRKDIAKLRSNEAEFKDGPTHAPRGYVLVWNVTDVKQGTNIGPQEYVKELTDGSGTFACWQTKASPLFATVPLSEAWRDWTIESWLWLVLAEVTQQESGSLQRDCRVI